MKKLSNRGIATIAIVLALAFAWVSLSVVDVIEEPAEAFVQEVLYG